MKKKVLILFLCMITALSGCGSQSGQKEVSSSQGGNAGEESMTGVDCDTVKETQESGAQGESSTASQNQVSRENWENIQVSASYEKSSNSDADAPEISSVMIRVSDADTGKDIQTIDYTYDFGKYGYPGIMNGEIFIRDVNYDDKEDILISLGSYGNSGTVYYACYLWNEEKGCFEQNLSFQDISNPVPSQEEAMILSFSKDGASDYLYEKYMWKDGICTKTASLAVKVSPDGASLYTESNLADGKWTVAGEGLKPEQLDENKWYIRGEQWHRIPGNSAARYHDQMEEMIGISTDDAVSFFHDLTEDMKNGRKEAIASLLHYPCVVKSDKGDTKLSDAKDFLEYYDRIFTEDYQKAVIAGTELGVVHNWQGASIGYGEIWINMLDGRICITALNGAEIGVYQN